MFEKRHKTNKVGDYQNIINEKQSRFRLPCFCTFQKRWSLGFWRNAHDQYTNPLAGPLMIALQVVRTSFGFYLRECMASSFPFPPRLLVLTELTFSTWRICCLATLPMVLCASAPVTREAAGEQAGVFAFWFYFQWKPLKCAIVSVGWWKLSIFWRLSNQERSVHIRTNARAYSWNQNKIFFLFTESNCIIKSVWLINFLHYLYSLGVFVLVFTLYLYIFFP